MPSNLANNLDEGGRASGLAGFLADDCRDAVRSYVSHYGLKRGLHLFALRAKVTERRARGMYSGEVRRVWADEWHGANSAHDALRRERSTALRAELAQIEERLNNDAHLDLPRPYLGLNR